MGMIVPRHSTGVYPDDWSAIAQQVKAEASGRCVRCSHPHDPTSGHTLTVHHLDLDKSNCRWWNLAALCQRCHLHIQGKVVMERIWMFEHSAWFKVYVAGYYAFHHGLPDDRPFVLAHVETLIKIGQGLEVSHAFHDYQNI